VWISLGWVGICDQKITVFSALDNRDAIRLIVELFECPLSHAIQIWMIRYEPKIAVFRFDYLRLSNNFWKRRFRPVDVRQRIPMGLKRSP